MSLFKSKPVLKVLVGLLFLIAGGAVFYFYAPDNLKKQLGLTPKINPAYSQDQQKVVANFGLPQAYKLVMNLDEGRHET